jgi:hypothetical protein
MSNFWTTLPEILTGLTGLIGALGAIHVTNSAISTTWTCYNKGNPVADNVTIWWGHRQEDAAWACDNWRSTCGNEGGCRANKISK